MHLLALMGVVVISIYMHVLCCIYVYLYICVYLCTYIMRTCMSSAVELHPRALQCVLQCQAIPRTIKHPATRSCVALPQKQRLTPYTAHLTPYASRLIPATSYRVRCALSPDRAGNRRWSRHFWRPARTPTASSSQATRARHVFSKVLSTVSLYGETVQGR